MTLEDLYIKLSSNEDYEKFSPLFNVYILTYEGWISNPNNEKLLETIYRILTDINNGEPELLKMLCDGDFNELTLPESIAEPEWIALKREALMKDPPDLGELNKVINLSQTELINIIRMKQELKYPKLKDQAKNFMAAVTEFTNSGFQLVTKEQYAARRKICEGCVYFDPEGFVGVGRCKKCGCSSYKLNMASSRCPMGLWNSLVD
jgi:hypothetical protein